MQLVQFIASSEKMAYSLTSRRQPTLVLAAAAGTRG